MTAAIERPSTDDRIRAALWFAEHGFGVFSVWSTDQRGTCRCPKQKACDNAGKHPITSRGFLDATQDAARIRTLLSAGSEPNYGLVCPDGVFAWDVDGELVAMLQVLEQELGPLPASLRTDTAHGYHAFYRWPDDLPRPIGQMFGMVTRWGSGRDAGYVIGPRSVHASGAVYTPAGVATIATLPDAWARRAVGPQADPETFVTVAQGGYELPERVPAGASRYEAIRDYTAHLYNRPLSVDEMWPLVRDLLAPRFAEPLSEADLRARFDRTTSKLPQRMGPPRGGTPAPAAPRSPDEVRATSIDASDLLELDIPPLQWIVPDLLPEGTTVLAGPPKLGKSCLVYQVAVEVALGGELLGREIVQGDVLYLALEDGKRRGQTRLRAALGDRSMPRGRLEVRWSTSKLGEGLEQELMDWLDQHPTARLVAIDTLQRVRARGDSRRNAYEVDVEDLARLQNIFKDRAVGLLIVHHSKKDAGDDFLASVSGTYGITGSADTTLVIQRKRLETFGKLVVTGRDVQETEEPVQFNGMTWSQAPRSVAEATFEQAEVYKVIEAEGPIFPKAIADVLGSERTAVQHLVEKLVINGSVARTTKGYVVAAFRLVDDDEGAERAQDTENDDIAHSAHSEPHARAHAGVPTHSTHSAHSESGDGVSRVSGDTHHTRAGASAREAPLTVVAGTDQPIVCHFYEDHRFEHHLVDGQWVCPICAPEPEVPA
jgi:hypothetical protein